MLQYNIPASLAVGMFYPLIFNAVFHCIQASYMCNYMYKNKTLSTIYIFFEYTYVTKFEKTVNLQ